MSRQELRRIGAGLALILLFILAASLSPARATTYTDNDLYGPGGMGGTVVWASVYSSDQPLGRQSNNYDIQVSQGFIPTRGTLDSFTVYFSATVGNPSGTVTWELRPYNGQIWGAATDTGTFTPQQSVLNTITVSNGSYLDDTQVYVFFLHSTNDQTAGNYWVVRVSSSGVSNMTLGIRWATSFSSSPYLDKYDYDGFGLLGSVTTTDDTPNAWLNDKYSQSFSVSLDTTISAVKLLLKKTGSPDGVLTARIEGTDGLLSNDTLIDPDATGTVNEADLGTSYAYETFTLSDPVTLHAGTKYHLTIGTDRESVTDYVSWASVAAVGSAEQLSKHEVLADTWTPVDFYGVYQLVADSFPARGEPITLDSGQTAYVDYTITAGDAAVVIVLMMILGLLAFTLLILLTRRRS